MPNTVLNCADVSDCSATSWDLLFCICNGGGCLPDTNALDIYPYTNQDGLDGLAGVYSTSWEATSTLPSTGTGANTWANKDNILVDSGSFASVAFSTAHGGEGGGQYLVATGPGLNVPSGATIYGIGVGIKGGIVLDNTNGAGIFNTAIMLGGTPYYLADPRGSGYPWGSYVAQSPYATSGGGGYWQIRETQPQQFGPGETQWGANGPFFIGLTNIVDPLYDESPGQADTGIWPPCWRGEFYLNYPNPIPKMFYIPTLKQSWSSDEVNDPSFGVAFSMYGGGFPTGNTFRCYALGIAVYYTGGTVIKRPPNVCVNT